MTEQDWFDFEQEYRALFGSNIPRIMLPADEEAAVALVRLAIETRSDGVFEQDIPSSCAI
ncbi:hypothetical protein [Thiobacillus sp.]